MQIETYADADGSRREDIAALKGDDAVACASLPDAVGVEPFSIVNLCPLALRTELQVTTCTGRTFYDRLRELRDYHRRYPSIDITEVGTPILPEMQLDFATWSRYWSSVSGWRGCICPSRQQRFGSCLSLRERSVWRRMTRWS